MKIIVVWIYRTYICTQRLLRRIKYTTVFSKRFHTSHKILDLGYEYSKVMHPSLLRICIVYVGEIKKRQAQASIPWHQHKHDKSRSRKEIIIYVVNLYFHNFATLSFAIFSYIFFYLTLIRVFIFIVVVFSYPICLLLNFSSF